MTQRKSSNWPTHVWRNITPQDAGINTTLLNALHAHADEQENLRSILIIRSGLLAFERYYNGCKPNQYQNIMSCTKCIVTTLVGIALFQGLLPNINQPILTFFPEYHPSQLDSRKQAITLLHMLTMTSGYDEPNAWGRAHSLPTYLAESATLLNVLDRPMCNEPGLVYSYDNLGTYLLGHVLQRVTKMSLAQFAYTQLFQPLGIWQDEHGKPFPWKNSPDLVDQPHPFGLWKADTDSLWSIDQQGDEIAAFGLQMTPQEMAKLGYLYLNRGIWDNKRILSSTYIRDCLHPYIANTPIGYANWRLGNRHGHKVPYGDGHGGQTIALVPDLDVVVVLTATPQGIDSDTLLNFALIAIKT